MLEPCPNHVETERTCIDSLSTHTPSFKHDILRAVQSSQARSLLHHSRACFYLRQGRLCSSLFPRTAGNTLSALSSSVAQRVWGKREGGKDLSSGDPRCASRWWVQCNRNGHMKVRTIITMCDADLSSSREGICNSHIQPAQAHCE